MRVPRASSSSSSSPSCFGAYDDCSDCGSTVSSSSSSTKALPATYASSSSSSAPAVNQGAAARRRASKSTSGRHPQQQAALSSVTRVKSSSEEEDDKSTTTSVASRSCTGCGSSCRSLKRKLRGSSTTSTTTMLRAARSRPWQTRRIMNLVVTTALVSLVCLTSTTTPTTLFVHAEEGSDDVGHHDHSDDSVGHDEDHRVGGDDGEQVVKSLGGHVNGGVNSGIHSYGEERQRRWHLDTTNNYYSGCIYTNVLNDQLQPNEDGADNGSHHTSHQHDDNNEEEEEQEEDKLIDGDTYPHNVSNGYDKLLRVCNSEDPQDAVERKICRMPPIKEYMEIRIFAQPWESVSFTNTFVFVWRAWLVDFMFFILSHF